MYITLVIISIILSISFITNLINGKHYLFALWLSYLFVEVVFGFIAREIIGNYMLWKIDFNDQFLYIYIFSISVMFSIFKVTHKNKTSFKFQINKLVLKKTILFLLVPFFLVTYKIYTLKTNSNAIDARGIMVAEISGMEFLIYKIGFVILSLLAISGIKKSKLYWILVIGVLFSFSLYGGRFLLFSGVLLFLINFFHNRIDYKKTFRLKYLLPIILVYISLSTFIANTRYYMSNNNTFVETFTIDKYSSTLYMQLGGNWLDFSRVANSNKNIDLSDHFFPTILEGFFPSGIRDYFFAEYFSDKIAYGKYFSESIYEENNALRMNFTNEIYFSFGYLGILVYSLLLGICFSYFDALLRTHDYSIAYFFLVQLISLHILGINTFSNSLILTFVYILVFRKLNMINLNKL